MMDKMQRAFREAGVAHTPASRDYLPDTCLTQRDTVAHVQKRNGVVSLMGRWVLQLKRPEFGAVVELIIQRRRRAESVHNAKCAVTGKRAYSVMGARRTLEYYSRKKGRVPVRMYACVWCGGQHLTSQEEYRLR